MDYKTIIFGAGIAGQQILERIGNREGVAFCDNIKKGTAFDTIIINFDELLEIADRVNIIVASFAYADEIVCQLELNDIFNYKVAVHVNHNDFVFLPSREWHNYRLKRETGRVNIEKFLSTEFKRLEWAILSAVPNFPRVHNFVELNMERKLSDPLYLERYEYKVYSQNGEDGIIAEIFNRIGISNRTFVEFGGQTGLENNCHYLLLQGWDGLWIEGNENSYNKMLELFEPALSAKKLTTVKAFVTAENINDLIGEAGIRGSIDLLSIDIDANDYHVWSAINVIQPRVVVVEYNAKFLPPVEWIIPYDPMYVWDKTDYFGASLKSFEKLGVKLGYQLVATNSNSSNAFFVKNDLAGDLFPKPATAENLYNVPSVYHRKYISCGHPNRRFIGYSAKS